VTLRFKGALEAEALAEVCVSHGGGGDGGGGVGRHVSSTACLVVCCVRHALRTAVYKVLRKADGRTYVMKQINMEGVCGRLYPPTTWYGVGIRVQAERDPPVCLPPPPSQPVQMTQREQLDAINEVRACMRANSHDVVVVQARL
jgi:hypothetical protein